MYHGRDTVYSPSGGSGMYSGDYRSYVHRSRGSSPMGRRHGRSYRVEQSGSHHDYPRRSPSMRPRGSVERDMHRFGLRSSLGRRLSKGSIPHAPSFGRRPMRGTSYVSSMASMRSPPGMRCPPSLPENSCGLSEKHRLPPYDTTYCESLEEDEEDELAAIERTRRIRRIVKYSIYAVLGLLLVLTCSLLAYFLSPRTPVVALHAVNSPDSVSNSKFKLQGTKLQFHVDLIYRVQNDNFFDMSVGDISTAVFWPDTNFALGGGRLSDIRIPARRTVQLTMPIAMRYDVKRGPPPVLLGMVESCGLHDSGIGEMNLEAEVQADVRTKMKQTAIQSGRQSISVKCPVRHMAMLQVDDGTSGNLGDIVRMLNA